MFNLGDIEFKGRLTFSGVTRQSSPRLAEQALVNGTSVLQHIGRDLQKMEVTVHLVYAFCNPSRVIARLQQASVSATVLPFTDSTGVNYGDFVIGNVEVTEAARHPDGTLMEAAVTLQLIEHGGEVNRLNTATALEENGILPGLVDALPVTATTEFLRDAERLSGGHLQIVTEVNKIRSSPGLAASAFRRIATLTEDVRRATTRMRDAYLRVTAVAGAIQATFERLDNIETAASQIYAAAQSGDLNGVFLSTETLGQAVENLASVNRPLILDFLFRR